MFLFSACSTDLVENKGITQGTSYTIKYISEGGEDYKQQIDSLLLEIDSSLSTYKEYSLISRLNKGEKIKIDNYFKDVFDAAKKVYIESDGDFDCSIAPLSNYWGFGFEDDISEIDSAEVKRRLNLVDFSKIKIVNDSLLLPKGMQLDFNSIAQGYSVDVVASFLEGKGIKNYLVEIGGELKANGVNPDGEYWTVGIDKPQEEIDLSDRYQLIISLENTSLATSGNYRKFKEINGVKYSHTINTKTGYFAKNRMLSVTIIHPSCMLSDAYATAFMAMGIKKSKEFSNLHPELKVYIVYSDKQGNWKTFHSENLEIPE
jgi:thiamine biosynthesis lipoprotein